MKNFSILLFLFLFFGCKESKFSDVKVDQILDEFEWQLQKDIRDDDLNGSISMIVLKGDKIIRSKAFGISDLSHSNADTSGIYRIGSISKSFTAFLMMRMVEKGIISLDEPVVKFFTRG